MWQKMWKYTVVTNTNEWWDSNPKVTNYGNLVPGVPAFPLHSIQWKLDIKRSDTEQNTWYDEVISPVPMNIYFLFCIVFDYWYNKISDIQCVPEKGKPINQVNFSQNCNDLSEKNYIVIKFHLSSFFWHQLQDVLAMHGQARTISNGDVKIDLRRIGI